MLAALLHRLPVDTVIIKGHGMWEVLGPTKKVKGLTLVDALQLFLGNKG